MDGKEIIEKGTEILNEMLRIEENEIVGKEEKLRKKKDEMIELVPNINKISYGDLSGAEVRKSKALIHYIVGRAFELNFDPAITGFHKEALKMLKRSVLLDSSLEDAWNTLGHYYQKEKNFAQSLKCYEKSIQQNKNKDAYLGLSTVVRNLQDENRFDQSVVHAKEAIKLDFSCPKSWYTLGNSYLYHYFSTHSQDDMEKAIKAYDRSEKLVKDRFLSLVPDINHNRSVLYFFEGTYEQAYQGFDKAFKLDPTLDSARVKMIQIQHFMKKIDNILEEKRSKRFMKGLKQMKSTSTLDNIVGKKITMKIVCLVSEPNATPLVYLLMDKQMKFCILSIYFVQSSVLKDEEDLTILNPVFGTRNLFLNEDPTKKIHSIKVRNPNRVRLNGKKIDPQKIQSVTMSSTYSK